MAKIKYLQNGVESFIDYDEEEFKGYPAAYILKEVLPVIAVDTIPPKRINKDEYLNSMKVDLNSAEFID